MVDSTLLYDPLAIVAPIVAPRVLLMIIFVLPASEPPVPVLLVVILVMFVVLPVMLIPVVAVLITVPLSVLVLPVMLIPVPASSTLLFVRVLLPAGDIFLD